MLRSISSKMLTHHHYVEILCLVLDLLPQPAFLVGVLVAGAPGPIPRRHGGVCISSFNFVNTFSGDALMADGLNNASDENVPASVNL